MILRGRMVLQVVMIERNHLVLITIVVLCHWELGRFLRLLHLELEQLMLREERLIVLLARVILEHALVVLIQLLLCVVGLELGVGHCA